MSGLLQRDRSSLSREESAALNSAAATPSPSRTPSLSSSPRHHDDAHQQQQQQTPQAPQQQRRARRHTYQIVMYDGYELSLPRSLPADMRTQQPTDLTQSVRQATRHLHCPAAVRRIVTLPVSLDMMLDAFWWLWLEYFALEDHAKMMQEFKDAQNKGTDREPTAREKAAMLAKKLAAAGIDDDCDAKPAVSLPMIAGVPHHLQERSLRTMVLTARTVPRDVATSIRDLATASVNFDSSSVVSATPRAMSARSDRSAGSAMTWYSLPSEPGDELLDTLTPEELLRDEKNPGRKLHNFDSGGGVYRGVIAKDGVDALLVHWGLREPRPDALTTTLHSSGDDGQQSSSTQNSPPTTFVHNAMMMSQRSLKIAIKKERDRDAEAALHEVRLEQFRIFCDMSVKYVALFQQLSRAQRDKCFNTVAEVMALTVFQVFYRTMPYLRARMTSSFKRDIKCRLTYWLTGIESRDVARWDATPKEQLLLQQQKRSASRQRQKSNQARSGAIRKSRDKFKSVQDPKASSTTPSTAAAMLRDPKLSKLGHDKDLKRVLQMSHKIVEPTPPPPQQQQQQQAPHPSRRHSRVTLGSTASLTALGPQMSQVVLPSSASSSNNNHSNSTSAFVAPPTLSTAHLNAHNRLASSSSNGGITPRGERISPSGAVQPATSTTPRPPAPDGVPAVNRWRRVGQHNQDKIRGTAVAMNVATIFTSISEEKEVHREIEELRLALQRVTRGRAGQHHHKAVVEQQSDEVAEGQTRKKSTRSKTPPSPATQARLSREAVRLGKTKMTRELQEKKHHARWYETGKHQETLAPSQAARKYFTLTNCSPLFRCFMNETGMAGEAIVQHRDIGWDTVV
eukprot:PhM_4_TR10517/c0_g1_i1/m.15391